MVDPITFREAFQRVAAPVTAISSRDAKGNPVGLMATAVTGLSNEPPSMVVCVNRNATAHDAILEAGKIGVSLIPDEATEFADHFARAKGVGRFSGQGWRDAKSGVPIYEAAPVAFDCEIVRCFDGYSHSILIAEIKEIFLADSEQDSCLLWHRQKFAKLAATEG